MIAKCTADEHRATAFFPWTTKVVTAICHTFGSCDVTVAEEQACIERTYTKARMHGLSHGQTGIGCRSDVLTAFQAAYLTVLKPLQSAVINKVSCTFNDTICEITSAAGVCLIGILESRHYAVIEDMRITVSKQRLCLSYVTCRIANGKVFGIETLRRNVQRNTICITVA